jgi:peptidoglycan/xylan/chitin deacetylase (PgdA/CDA1 family)
VARSVRSRAAGFSGPVDAVRGDVGTDRLRVLAKRALGTGAVGGAVRRVAALRGRSLVLVYHRVAPGPPPTDIVVPCVPSDLLQRQIEALQDVGEIVPLEILLHDRDRHAKPRFGLTFDDDYATHFHHALPVLKALDAPATFFLSGRALGGLGSYWFELLERLIVSRGVAEVSHLLGTATDGLEALILACENDSGLQERLEAEAIDAPRHLDREQIEALAGAGMAIGFHTVQHPVMTRLPDRELEGALTSGRDLLESVVGRPLLHFAYPHGRANQRTADKVRRAGYEAAWTGRPKPMQPGHDPFLLGRWEPGPLKVDDFLIGTAIRLNRGVP